jgi:hypothetical protein
MEDADGYFPERVAATYDDSSEGMFDPSFTDTVAEVLAGLAGMRLEALDYSGVHVTDVEALKGLPLKSTTQRAKHSSHPRRFPQKTAHQLEVTRQNS